MHRHINLIRLKPELDPDRVDFETGYDRAALGSYRTFRRLRDDGSIPAGVRFQVALPTPMATGLMYVSPVGRDRYLRAYERGLLNALTKILSGIPHSELSIQFDVCQEVLLFENYFPVREPDYKRPVFEQFGRLAASVPTDVELGYHLCYGSPGDQPLLRLKDATVLVELMNGIADFVKRRVEFIHIPVPKQAGDSSSLHSAVGGAPQEHSCISGCCNSTTKPVIEHVCVCSACYCRIWRCSGMRLRTDRSGPYTHDPQEPSLCSASPRR